MAPERWRIEGTLEALTPVRIGSGESAPPERGATDDSSAAAALVARGADGPHLPGTAIKGLLRRWLEACALEGGDRDCVERLLGRPAERDDGGAGGCADIHDAPMSPDAWREVAVEMSTAIDRDTRTALDRHLFAAEHVPAGAAFAVTVDVEWPGDDAPRAVGMLLAALGSFRADDQGGAGTSLGARTRIGYGRLQWKLGKVSRLGPEELLGWLREGGMKPWHAALREVGGDVLDGVRERCREITGCAPVSATLTFDLRIRFDAGFLVADHERGDGEGDLQPREDASGNPLLPGSSLKGALRAQAERIAAALDGEVEGHRARSVERLFGTTSRGGALRIDAFRSCGEKQKLTQEFVAVDRFTGGVSGSAKFDASYFYRPEFEGALRLDLDRVDPADVGLVVLLVRDLVEGDVPLGALTRRGHGACTAKCTVKGRGEVSWEALAKDPSEARDFLLECVDACRNMREASE